jgi:hypothetical protein
MWNNWGTRLGDSHVNHLACDGCHRYEAKSGLSLCGAVAQLGERLNGIQEVDGSIPFSSTIFV